MEDVYLKQFTNLVTNSVGLPKINKKLNDNGDELLLSLSSLVHFKKYFKIKMKLYVMYVVSRHSVICKCIRSETRGKQKGKIIKIKKINNLSHL